VTAERQVRFWLIGLAITIAALYLLRDVLLPFVAGMAVAYFLDPLADRLERAGCSRTVATSLITIVFILALVAASVVLLPLIVDQVRDLVDRIPQYMELFRERVLPRLEGLLARVAPEDMERLRDAVGGYVGEAARWLGRVLKGIVTSGLAIFNLLSLIFITPIVAFYLLRDWDRILVAIDGWLPRHHAEVIRGVLTEIDDRLAGFVRGQGTVCLILGGFYAIALTVIGLDFGLVVGLIAGAISFIPFVGSIVGLVLSVGLALLQFDSWQWVAGTAAIFAFGQAVEGNLLTPKLVGGRVGLHPVWVIFALLAGGALLGFVGVLLAVPLAATVGVLARFGVGQYLKSHLYLGGGGGGERAPIRAGEDSGVGSSGSRADDPGEGAA